ncbi:MAG: DUF1080 domain-containing protein, partial [Sediminibacterium sp.]
MKQRTLRSFLVLTLSVVLVTLTAFSYKKTMAENDQTIIGRWDLTVNMGDRIAPSWLEVKLSGIQTLVGQFVADGGSARPIA